MKTNFEDVIEGRRLSVDESRALMHEILRDTMPLSRVAALLTALRIHGISVDLLDGFTQAVSEVAAHVDLGSRDLLDVCGTGGDGKDTFNISTAVAFVLAGAGYKVAKHGNVGVSSSCGSSTVLEALGVKLVADRDHLCRSLDQSGVCFLHAPLFHPAMRRVAPVRKELGFRTVFNALGPLVNPANPAFQYNGVYNLELHRLYSYLLRRREKRFAVVHSLDGYDEVSLTAPTRITTREGTQEITASDLGVAPLTQADLRAPGSIDESARLLIAILERRATSAQTAVVIANASVAMMAFEGKGSLADYRARAEESIHSGAARTSLQRSIEV